MWSPDSQSLVFSSSAADLTANAPDSVSNPDQVSAGIPGSENLYLRNMSAGTTTLLSVTTKGRISAGESLGAVFSPDGKSVAFVSSAADLTASAVDTTPPIAGLAESKTFDNVYVTQSGHRHNHPGQRHARRFAVQRNRRPARFQSRWPLPGVHHPRQRPHQQAARPHSAAGRIALWAMFTPPADNLFLTNLATGTTTLVSVTPTGMMSSGMVGQILFSPDGKLLAFTSNAGDLTNNPMESSPALPPGAFAGNLSGSLFPTSNVFVRDLTAQTTTLASVTTSGQLSNSVAGGLIFSPDSKSLFFSSTAGDLTSNPPDAASSPGANANLFVRDLPAAATSLISATTSGQLSANIASANAFLSPDGKTLYFDSGAGLLTAGDSNASTDIFTASAPFTAPKASPRPSPLPRPSPPPRPQPRRSRPGCRRSDALGPVGAASPAWSSRSIRRSIPRQPRTWPTIRSLCLAAQCTHAPAT